MPIEKPTPKPQQNPSEVPTSLPPETGIIPNPTPHPEKITPQASIPETLEKA